MPTEASALRRPERRQQDVRDAGRYDDVVSGIPESTALLAAATRRLAETIAQTERLAQARAELLRTSDGSAGGGSRAIGTDLISLGEAARRSGRHPEVLRRWCLEGRLPAVRVGRSWAITRDSLSTLMAHRNRARPRMPGVAQRR